jgi:hypothetical protein
MTRFDADTETERRQLFAEAITAHRTRESEFLTIEPDELPSESTEELMPWIQFSDTTVSMDCTDEELERLKGLLDSYPEFRAESLESPEEAEGTHAQITARSDANRLAMFIDEAFQTVYGYESTYTAWVVAI